MEGEELQFCLLELISDQGAAWPLYRQHRDSPWAYTSDPCLEKLQQQRSWNVGLGYGALGFLWLWTVERSQGIAIKSSVEFVLGRERKPNQGNVFKHVPAFFPQSWPTNRLQWMSNSHFFCFIQAKFKKINFDFISVTWGFCPRILEHSLLWRWCALIFQIFYKLSWSMQVWSQSDCNTELLLTSCYVFYD